MENNNRNAYIGIKTILKSAITQTIAALLFTLVFLVPISDAEEKSVVGPPENPLKSYPMRFAVIGDRTGGVVPGIYGRIVKEIDRLKPDFVLNVGDMIEGYSEDKFEVRKQYEAYKKLLEPLTMPIYPVPGNHDIWDDDAVDLYKECIGEPYYSFDRRGVHFVMLDSGRYESIEDLEDDQIKWLEQDLATHDDALYTIAVLHKPFWIENIAKGKADKLHDIFVAHGVDAVFTGHYHCYFAGEYDGVKYTSVGSSGGGTREDAAGLMYHFVWATFDGEKLSLAPIRKDAVLPWDHMTSADILALEKIHYKAVRMDKIPAGDDLTVDNRKVAIEIVNYDDKRPIEDLLKWKIPQGWQVEPQRVKVKAAPGESFTATFTVRCTDNLYPTPSLTLKFPYREGKFMELEKNLAVFRTTVADRMKTPATIDGKLTEKDWGTPTTVLFKSEYAKTESEPTRFYFAYDNDNLYLAARCTESNMQKIVAQVKKRDGMIFKDDSIGYLIQPNEGGPVFLFYFNPLGTVFDQKITIDAQGGYHADKKWNGQYEMKTLRGASYWNIEIRLPLAQFGVHATAGKTFALNFSRKQARLNSSADWQSPISTYPESLGELRFR